MNDDWRETRTKDSFQAYIYSKHPTLSVELFLRNSLAILLQPASTSEVTKKYKHDDIHNSSRKQCHHWLLGSALQLEEAMLTLLSSAWSTRSPHTRSSSGRSAGEERDDLQQVLSLLDLYYLVQRFSLLNNNKEVSRKKKWKRCKFPQTSVWKYVRTCKEVDEIKKYMDSSYGPSSGEEFDELDEYDEVSY